MNEPDRHRVAVEFSVAGLDGGDDDEDGVQDPEDNEENEADQDQTKTAAALLRGTRCFKQRSLPIRCIVSGLRSEAGFSELESQEISHRLLQPGYGRIKLLANA